MKVVVKSKNNDKKEANTIIYHEQPKRRHRTIRSRHSSLSDSPRNEFSSLSSDDEFSKENIKSRGEARAKSKSAPKKKSQSKPSVCESHNPDLQDVTSSHKRNPS